MKTTKKRRKEYEKKVFEEEMYFLVTFDFGYRYRNRFADVQKS